jgi:nitroreductase
LQQCPILILVFYKPSPERIEQVIADTLGTGNVNRFNPNLVSVGMAVSNLVLAAQEQGLDACVHFASVAFLAGAVNRSLGLPPHLHLAAVISLGYPEDGNEQPAPFPMAQDAVTFLDPDSDNTSRLTDSPEALPAASRSIADLARTRTSVRRYQARPVPRPLLSHLVDLATTVPWPLPSLPWRFVVADTPSRREEIVQLLENRITAMESLDLDESTAYLVHPFLDHQRQWNHPLEEGQALVLCCYQDSLSRYYSAVLSALGEGEAIWHSPELCSLGMAAQILLLAAHGSGIGACMQSGPVPFMRGFINPLVGQPPDAQLAGVVSLGFPAEEPEPRGRKQPDRVSRYLDRPLADAQ